MEAGGRPGCYLDLPPPLLTAAFPGLHRGAVGSTAVGRAAETPALQIRHCYLRGAQENLPHTPTLRPPTTPALPWQAAWAGGWGGREAPFLSSDPTARRFLKGLPQLQQCAIPPSPYWGSACKQASSRWRRRGRALRRAHWTAVTLGPPRGGECSRGGATPVIINSGPQPQAPWASLPSSILLDALVMWSSGVMYPDSNADLCIQILLCDLFCCEILGGRFFLSKSTLFRY